MPASIAKPEQGSIAGEPLEKCAPRSAEPVQGFICIRLVAIAVFLVEGGHIVGDVVVVEGIVDGDTTRRRWPSTLCYCSIRRVRIANGRSVGHCVGVCVRFVGNSLGALPADISNITRYTPCNGRLSAICMHIDLQHPVIHVVHKVL